jgi:uncharacterized protein (UPF0335 family)
MVEGVSMTLDKSKRDRLVALVGSYERLETEKKAIAEQQAELMKTAKDTGIDTAALKDVLKLSKMSERERMHRLDIMDMYQHALGMTPLDEAIEEAKAAAA